MSVARARQGAPTMPAQAAAKTKILLVRTGRPNIKRLHNRPDYRHYTTIRPRCVRPNVAPLALVEESGDKPYSLRPFSRPKTSVNGLFRECVAQLVEQRTFNP